MRRMKVVDRSKYMITESIMCCFNENDRAQVINKQTGGSTKNGKETKNSEKKQQLGYKKI